MNTQTRKFKQLTSITLATVLIAACASTPSHNENADLPRARLTRLQADPELASRASIAINDAETAVRAAESAPRRDAKLTTHLVFIADRKVDIAWAQARGRLLEDQRKTLIEERESARLEARTREADRAHREADVARADAEYARHETRIARQDSAKARQQTGIAQTDADTARSQTRLAREDSAEAKLATDAAQQQVAAARSDASIARDQAATAREDTAAARLRADALQRQIAQLNARETDRGWVVTLGDVLFATGRSELKGGAPGDLGRLAEFLKQYPERTVSIEGHTDDVGSPDSNLTLSQHRANSVKSFLVGHGVGPNRLDASGLGEGSPVASNDSATGRQQNRRVEVIISNVVENPAMTSLE